MWRTLGNLFIYIIYIKTCSKYGLFQHIGYQTYPSPNPTVRVIKIKTEYEMEKITNDNKVCDQHIYFNRPSNLYPLTFTTFFQLYNYGTKLPRHHMNIIQNDEESSYYSIFITHMSKNYFVYKRNENCKNITRLEMVPLTVGEKWYIRLILYNKPVVSFKDARTIDGITYPTFQQAALAAGLVEDENEATTAFQWATVYSTPSELRTLFIIMTTQGFPTLKLYNDISLRIKLMDDFLLDFNNNER